MTAVDSDFDVKQTILLDGSFGPQETSLLTAVLNSDAGKLDTLREAVVELETEAPKGQLSPAGYVRLGVGNYLLGYYGKAAENLKHGDGGALAAYYAAKSQFALGLYSEALKNYDSAQKSGYNPGDCALGKAEIYRYQNNPKKSWEQLEKCHGPVEQTAEYLYHRGETVAMLLDDDSIENPSEQAVNYFERGFAADKTHPGVLFGLAKESERRGNDEEALELYKKAASRFPVHTGVLFNLGVLYEDREMYDHAVVCYQRIVDAQPNNQRARLFLKDAKASNDMHVDEEVQRRKDRVSQVLNLPVSDFELSVRCRNCLKSMGIMTLGELCRYTEHDLLASKNFGDQSLVEIKEMLTLKGLQLGQLSQERPAAEERNISSFSTEDQETLLRPVIDLNLSVRARKCMHRLNIQTIGELVRYTADELLKCKNFGVTSLNEIREKLVNFNISLRGE
ncbi:MAG: DNA-directed RNA polymerase subunit alpha [Planctomycetaceae bacterium]|jgi:DNA-directed RNA polymerase subunit alpha|nr:DNA-directed RNA polymerase subunit alpha [Planctomycetaceae bacterium]